MGIRDKLDFIEGLREDKLSYGEIGEILGVSRERVRQVHKNIFKKRNPFTKIKKDWKPKNVSASYLVGLSKLEGKDLTREKIRIRDNHTCQICGKKWEEGQRRLDVHHKDCDKEKTNKYETYDDAKDNCITLCHKCHLRLPEHRKSMIIKK